VGACVRQRTRMLGATSDEFARRMDEVQYAVDDGPCLRCLHDGVPVIATDPRWPAFTQRGRSEGAGTSLSVPLRVDGKSIGALNLYSRQAPGLDDTDQARAAQFADRAAGAVALAMPLARSTDQQLPLERALISRSAIDQAIGVIRGMNRLNAEEAFAVLRKRSQRSNIKLREVATAVLDEVTDSSQAT
jgi:GAF domain-containing protein